MRLSLAGQLIIVHLMFPFGEIDCSVSLKITPPPSTETVEVTFHIDTYFSVLYVDDLKLAGNDSSTAFGQRFTHRLPPGQHKVTIESTCCKTDEFQICAPEPGTNWAPTVIRRKLQFLPASLVLDTQLSPLEIWLDGKFKGIYKAAKPASITIPIASRSGRRIVHLLLMHPRFGETRRIISVYAGDKTIVRVRKVDFR